MDEIFLALGKSKKTVYQSRTNLMKKMRLTNKKDLHMMLKFCEFVEYYTFRKALKPPAITPLWLTMDVYRFSRIRLNMICTDGNL